MTIQRPNCMKTLRQGSVSISLSPAARSCAGPRPASGVSGYQDPAGGHEEGAVANHRERPVSRDTALRISCRTLNICVSPRADAIAAWSTDQPVRGGPQRRCAKLCGTHRGWSRRGLARDHERSGSHRGCPARSRSWALGRPDRRSASRRLG